MTNIVFYKNKDMFTGFEIIGHTGKDEYGKDLLCCQISTVAQLAIVGLSEIKDVSFFKEISDGYLKISVKSNFIENLNIQFLFKTCYKSFQSIIIDEKKYAKLEVKNV